MQPKLQNRAKGNDMSEQNKEVGVAGTMPGTNGFTMACFHAKDVPVGTKLYIVSQSPASIPEQAASIEGLTEKQIEDIAHELGNGKNGTGSWLFRPLSLIKFVRAIERLLATQSAKQGAQPELHDGYLGSTMIHGTDGSKIVLHYDRSSQAEAAHEALCNLIDASQAAPEQAAQVDAIMAAINQACGTLPVGYEVVLEMENGAGGVVWTDDEGERYVIDGNGFISDDITHAVERAIEHAAMKSKCAASTDGEAQQQDESRADEDWFFHPNDE